MTGAAVVVFLISDRSAVGTDGIEPIGASMPAQARGGADIAVGDTALSQIVNPATLHLHREPRFDLSGELLMPHLHWDGAIDSNRSRSIHPLANMAFAFPVDERLTLGMALQSKSGMGSDFQMRHLLIPFQRRHVGCDLKNVSLSFNAAYPLTDKLTLGVGGRAEMITCKFTAVLGPAAMEFERGYAYGGGFDLGLHYKVTERLALAAAYRSPSWFGDMSGGDLNVAMFGVAPFTLGEVSMDEWRCPQRISVGTAWDATDWMKLVSEVRWVNYSNSTFHKATMAVDGPVDLRFPFPLGYTDQWIAILGAEFALSTHWRLGVGYNYCTNPVPSSYRFPISPAIIQHHATIGLRYEHENWWIGGGYIRGFKAALSGTGSSRIPFGIDYGASRVEHQQHSVFFGFGFRW